MILSEFLLERISEDEAVVAETLRAPGLLDWTPERGWPEAVGLSGPVDGPSGYTSIVVDPLRVLAECAAKRRIVEIHSGGHECPGVGQVWWSEEHDDWTEPCPTMRALAVVYAGHPDCQQEWTRPDVTKRPTRPGG